MSAAGWIRVASGFRLVASAASKIVAKEGANGAAKLTRHGVDLANNARTAAKAAGVVLPSQMPPQMGRNNTFVPNTHINSAISEPVASSGLEQSADPVEHISNATKAQNARAPDEESNHLESEISMDGESIPKTQQQLNDSNPTLLQEGRAVPSTRIGRAAGFASLGVGLAAGTMFEAASRLVGGSSSESVVANDANADRLAKTLCRMRGAALKLGQMLSIQDATLLPAPLARALEQVRQGADAMPSYQLHEQLKVELGQDWKNRFDSFQDLPFAAASIGQVHRATIDQDGVKRQVVVKVQYPGVADSIDSDLSNLTMLVKYSGFAPPGLFIDRVIDVGRDELKVECDYKREAVNQERLRDLVHGDADLSKAKFRIPAVFTNHSTKGILTSEFCPGGTIDKVAFLDQEERNRIGRNIMRLTVKELFTWRFMQTDPNWGNFLYDVGTGTTYLIDFGSTREYSKSFVDAYLRIVWACANNDTQTLMAQSLKMGFLTGEENDIMIEAHRMSGFTLGEPFAIDGEYDFKDSGITGRISEHGSAFMQHRLTPPPEEVYTLHRKLAGAFNLCIKLGANIKCRDLLEAVLEEHVFEDGQPHPTKGS
jgi:aarF domain-containing kinase